MDVITQVLTDEEGKPTVFGLTFDTESTDGAKALIQYERMSVALGLINAIRAETAEGLPLEEVLTKYEMAAKETFDDAKAQGTKTNAR